MLENNIVNNVKLHIFRWLDPNGLRLTIDERLKSLKMVKMCNYNTLQVFIFV